MERSYHAQIASQKFSEYFPSTPKQTGIPKKSLHTLELIKIYATI